MASDPPGRCAAREGDTGKTTAGTGEFAAHRVSRGEMSRHAYGRASEPAACARWRNRAILCIVKYFTRSTPRTATPSAGSLMAPVLLLTVLAVLASLAAAVMAFAAKRRRAALLALAAGAIVSACYTAALLAVSVGSVTERLPLGDVKRFCGFYLDCHVGVSVVAVEQRDRLADSTGTVLATPVGRFWLVRVRISSNARAATLGAVEPLIEVIDSAGTHFAPSPDGQRALIALHGPQPALAGPLAPNGARDRWFAFDLPAAVRTPALWVKDDLGATHVEEKILIGDEDAVFHAPVLLALVP